VLTDVEVEVEVEVDFVVVVVVVDVVFDFGRQHLILLEAPGHKPLTIKPSVQLIGFIHLPP